MRGPTAETLRVDRDELRFRRAAKGDKPASNDRSSTFVAAVNGDLDADPEPMREVDRPDADGPAFGYSFENLVI